MFYSFRRNAIPSTSLFHPCKVAFLPKGAELPLGIFAFVGRRVYDIETSHLWWLTDQNYLNVSCVQISSISLWTKTRSKLFLGHLFIKKVPLGATGRDKLSFTEDSN